MSKVFRVNKVYVSSFRTIIDLPVSTSPEVTPDALAFGFVPTFSPVTVGETGAVDSTGCVKREVRYAWMRWTLQEQWIDRC